MIEIRKAGTDPESADSMLMWEWRNDPITRQMSRETGEITLESHKSWYAKAAKDPKKAILMAYSEGSPICMVRFDYIDKDYAEININMNPATRGKGLGKPVLEAGCRYGFENLGLKRIYAEIKPENIPSIKIFEGTGFVFAGMREGICTYNLAKGSELIDKITIRNATPADIDEVMRVEREAWPPEIQAPREKFESRLKIFPQGFFVAVLNGKIMGVSTSEMIMHNNSRPPEKWEGITDNGWIAKTHNPKGNAAYIVSLGVSPLAGGKGLGSMLIQAQKELVKKLSLNFLVLGARCPEYHKHEFDSIPVEQYVSLRRDDKQLRDMELRFYERNGLKVIKPVLRYMDEDPESRHYGVVMAWNAQTVNNKQGLI
jgi:RimJ/RimL family protein N-acetyltransferase